MSLWYDYPSTDLVPQTNGETAVVTTFSPNEGDVAKYSVNLEAGDEFTILFNEDLLNFPSASSTVYVAPATAEYIIYVNSTYNVYVDQLAVVTFNVNYGAGYGKALYAVGDFSGDYEPWPMFKLTWTDGDNWTGTISLPVGKHLKLCVAPDSNPTKGDVSAWESIERTISGDMSVTGWDVA